MAVSGLPVRPLSEQKLADLLGRGLEMYDLYLDPPVAKDAHHVVPLLRSRLRLLPEPREIEAPETSDEQREALIEAFAGSPEAAELGEGDRAADVARHFIDFACDYGAGDPLRWSPIAVEICLLDWLPRKAILDPDEVATLPDVFRRWIRFAGRRKGLSDALIAEILESVDAFASEFAKAMTGDSRAGPAKQVAMAMLADDVDLSDDAAVQRWLEAYNARSAKGPSPRR